MKYAPVIHFMTNYDSKDISEGKSVKNEDSAHHTAPWRRGLMSWSRLTIQSTLPHCTPTTSTAPRSPSTPPSDFSFESLISCIGRVCRYGEMVLRKLCSKRRSGIAGRGRGGSERDLDELDESARGRRRTEAVAGSPVCLARPASGGKWDGSTEVIVSSAKDKRL